MTQTRFRASLDYLTLDITSPNTAVIASDSVQLCFSKALGIPSNPLWFDTSNNQDGTVTVLVGPQGPALVSFLEAGCWFIGVRVVDDPTIPVFSGGDLYILGSSAVPAGGGGGFIPLTIVDNGDGTFTISGTYVTDNGDGTWTVAAPGVVDNNNGSFTVTA